MKWRQRTKTQNGVNNMEVFLSNKIKVERNMDARPSIRPVLLLQWLAALPYYHGYAAIHSYSLSYSEGTIYEGVN